MKKRAFKLVILIFILAGCKDQAPQVSENDDVDNQAQIEQLKNQIADLEKKNNEEKEALRTTMNLAFQFFTAINHKDFDSISSMSSSNIQVNGEEGTITSDNRYQMNEMDYLLENLEYRFYDLADEKMTIGFANYFFEGHSTIYLEFIQQEGQWRLDSIVTDA